MAFFAFAEGALAAPRSVRPWPHHAGRCARCSVLRFPPALCRREVGLFLFAAAAPSGCAALIYVASKPGINAAGGGQGVRGLQCIVWRAAVLRGWQPMEVEGIVSA